MADMIEVRGSSNITAAEWSEGVFRVRFRDGSEYSATVGEEVYREFLIAPSKGRFIHERLADKLLLTGNAYQSIGNATANSIDEDECCGPGLSRALRATPELMAFICGKCGTEWKPTDRGTFRQWSPIADFAIIKRR